MNPLLTLAIGAVALLYASVGHAGATGYIAVMTLFGLDPQVIRPTVIGAVVVGAAVGSQLGAFRVSPRMLRRLMGVVLVVAGLKLLLKAGL